MFDRTDLLCSLCYSNYGNGFPQRVPRNLGCGHTYCTECIAKLKQLQGNVLECPSCKLRTFLPGGQVDKLAQNDDILQAALNSGQEQPRTCNFCARKVYPAKPATFYCSDCDVYTCGSCSDEIHSQLDFKGHDVSLASAAMDSGIDTASVSSLTSSCSNLSKRTSSLKVASRPSSGLLDFAAIPLCPEHEEKLKFYCRNCNCVCCGYCQLYGQHKNHNCFQVHEAEERERKALIKLQAQVEKHGEKYIKARGDVQKTIEDVKQNTISAKDLVRRYYRELRAAIDEGEKVFVQELSKRSETKLKDLNEQLSEMIEISSRAFSASRNCDSTLNLDYYEMLTQKKQVESEMLDVLGLLCETVPVALADLKCQFPNHESLLSNIRTCAKLVLPPGPPEKLTCSVTGDKNVRVSWSPPRTNLLLYPVIRYVVQGSTGPSDSFVCLYEGSECSTIVDRLDAELPLGRHVQFRASALNIVGQGTWSSPYGVKVPE